MDVDSTVRRAERHRLARQDAAADPDRWFHPGEVRRPVAVRVLTTFAVLAPVAVTVLCLVDVRPGAALTVGVLFAAAELPVLAVVLPWLRSEHVDAPAATTPAAASADGQASGEGDSTRDHEDLLHELRSTVVGIVLTHHLLQDAGPELGDQRRDRLELLEGVELSRLERMVTREGRDETPSPLSLSQVIGSSVEIYRVRGSEIHWQGTDAVAEIDADDLTEILHILLENARVHAPGAPVTVSVDSDDMLTTVTVADRGPGVPRPVTTSVFARGFRSGDHPGQGLGLDVARRLARRMGGVLELRSTPGGGSTFALRLPTTGTTRTADDPGPGTATEEGSSCARSA